MKQVMILIKKKLNNELIKVKKNLDEKSFNLTELETELNKKNDIKNLNIENNKKIQELQEELENTYKLINDKRTK